MLGKDFHGMILFKVENKTRLWHLANILGPRDDCGVYGAALHFKGKSEVPLEPFSDLFPGDVVLPVTLTKKISKKVVFDALSKEGLFFNTVDMSEASLMSGGGDFEKCGMLMMQALGKATPLPLNDLFDDEAEFPARPLVPITDEEEEQLAQASLVANGMGRSFLNEFGDVDCTFIAYPPGSEEAFAINVTTEEGDGEGKDRTARMVSRILHASGSNVYSMVSSAWMYDSKNGEPDRSKRREVMMVTTIHRNGQSRQFVLPIIRNEDGSVRDVGENLVDERTPSGGRFATIFDLFPCGKAEERQVQFDAELPSRMGEFGTAPTSQTVQ